MPLVKANGLDIEVEQHGDPSHPPVMLVMGLATQLVHWPPALIQSLVDEGYRVITFDNRDIGLSERLHHENAPAPALMLLSNSFGLGWMLAPYKLEDMAADTLGVLDALDIEQAHLLGVSMGGMIGQIVSARHPDRIKSFTSIMSSTNNKSLPKTKPEVVRAIINARSVGMSKEEQLKRSVGVLKMIGTPNSGRKPGEIESIIANAIDRCSYPEGVRRQIAAIVASGDLRSWSRKIRVPTLVMHGKVDALTPYQGSIDIANNVKGAQLELIEEMGHDLPPRHMDRLVGHIIEHLENVERSGDSSQAA